MSVVTVASLAAGVTVGLAAAGWPARSRGAPSRPERSRPDRSRTDGRRRPGPGPRAVALVPVVATAVAVATVGPLVTAGVAGLVAVARAVQVRATRRRRDRAVEAAVPDLVDLFVLAASAGHPVAGCLDRVAARAPAAVRPAVVEARSRVAGGEPVATALDRLGPALGELGPHLTDALVAGLRTGAPLVPTLDQVAAAARDRRRRSAEEQARRLPVTLLFPLVGCVLPAFGLLAVVPLLVASLGSLSA